MSDEFFTRETWRPSKKRKMQKRTKPWGGRKTAPPAFLEAAKRTRLGSGVHRICRATKRDGKPCGNIALSGLTVCGPHGGFGVWARQGKLNPTGKAAAIRAAAVEGRSPSVPMALAQLPIYRAANWWTRVRLARAWETDAWMVLVGQIKAREIDTEVCV